MSWLLAFLFSFFWIIPCQIPAPSLYICCPMWGNRRQSCILDSTPWILDSNYWISDLFSGLRFQIPVVSEMPNSYSCIQDSKAQDIRIPQARNFQDSGYHRQKFPGCLYMWRMYVSNEFGMCILIPSAMLYFEYWIVLEHDYLSHWMDANCTS